MPIFLYSFCLITTLIMFYFLSVSLQLTINQFIKQVDDQLNNLHQE